MRVIGGAHTHPTSPRLAGAIRGGAAHQLQTWRGLRAAQHGWRPPGQQLTLRPQTAQRRMPSHACAFGRRHRKTAWRSEEPASRTFRPVRRRRPSAAPRYPRLRRQPTRRLRALPPRRSPSPLLTAWQTARLLLSAEAPPLWPQAPRLFPLPSHRRRLRAATACLSVTCRVRSASSCRSGSAHTNTTRAQLPCLAATPP